MVPVGARSRAMYCLVARLPDHGWPICRVAKTVGWRRVIETHQIVKHLVGLEDSTTPYTLRLKTCQPWLAERSPLPSVRSRCSLAA